MITTRKFPKSLEIKIFKYNNKKTIYNGFANKAVKLFPKNECIATGVSISRIGFDKPKVGLIADLKVENNIHEIYVKGAFGKIKN